MEGVSEDVKKEETKPKEIPLGLQKICLVCGDKALGYNFNAISCESCKAFFRRNAKTTKEFKCPFTNNCDITIVTRRFCQKCRLEKCLSIGMVKEFIMTDEGKAEKRRKIEENRAKKRQSAEQDDGVSSSKSVKTNEISNYIPLQENTLQYDILNSTTCSPNSTVQSPVQLCEDSISINENTSMKPPMLNNNFVPTDSVSYFDVYPIDEKSVITQSLYEHRVMMEQYAMADSMDNTTNSLYASPEKPVNSIRSLLTNADSKPVKESKSQHVCEELPSTSSEDPSFNKAKEILQDVERIEPNSMESILCEAIKLEFEAYSSVSHCGSSRELNEVERAKLNELIVANKALHAPIDDDLSTLIGDANTSGLSEEYKKHDPRLITIVNLTAIAIRRFIMMAKKINAFKNMCEEDQVALLKGGCIEMLILRSTMTYDNQRKSWQVPHSQEEFGCINTDLLKLAKGDIYRSHEAFIRSFDPRWRTDENIILIMSAILLFTPDRAKVVHKDVIKLEQNSYYYLLRRYLESVYAGCEAKSTFLKLIHKILEIRKFAEEVTDVYLDVNPIEPLLMEIFDLKHHAA